MCAFLVSHEDAHVHAIGKYGARAQARVGADLGRALGDDAVQVAVRAHQRAGAQAHVAQAGERADHHAVAQFDIAFEDHVDIDADISMPTFTVPRWSTRAGSARVRALQA